MATYHVDLVNGSNSNNGLSAALPVKTLNAMSAPVAGDLIKIKASPAPVAVGGAASATWNDLAKSLAVTWSTQQVMDIATCAVAWTAGAQGSGAALDTTTYKKATQTSTCRITKGTGTGQIEYFATGTLDLSGYQQVSFWVRASTAMSGVSARLCSDALGVTTVHTVNIPTLVANRWTLVTVDLAGNLSASIQSIALYADTATATCNIWLDNIIACKNAANALTLTSLIGKNTSAETWYGIQSISNIGPAGCTVWLDNQTETLGNAGRGYAAQTSGLNETLTLYKREPITYQQMGLALGSAVMIGQTNAGTGALPIRYEFGYSDLTLSSPDSETWIDVQNGSATPIGFSKNYTSIIGVAVVRGIIGININANTRGCILNTPGVNNNAAQGFNMGQSSGCRVTVSAANNNGSTGVQSAGLRDCRFLIGQANNNISNGISVGHEEIWSPFGELFHANNNVAALAFSGALSIVKRLQTWNGGGLSIGLGTSSGNTLVDSKFSSPGFGNPAIGSIITSLNHNQVAGDHRIFSESVTISAVRDANRHTLSGAAWKCNITTNSLLRDQYFPMPVKLARLACIANRSVTVRAWMKRDNLNAIGQLLVTGGDIAGVAADVAASTAGAINTYEQVSLTFTPTENGFVDLIWNCYSSVSGVNIWIDDVETSGLALIEDVNTLDFSDRGTMMIAPTDGHRAVGITPRRGRV